jgi:hypothetical protein
MNHNEKKQLIQSDPEMIQMIELIEKNIKIIMVNILHIFKKIEECMSSLRKRDGVLFCFFMVLELELRPTPSASPPALFLSWVLFKIGSDRLFAQADFNHHLPDLCLLSI